MDGKIVSIKPFGLFVEFAGTTGLLHINQISKNYVSSLETLFSHGQPIKALIVDVDDIRKRVSLSTKLLENFPGEILESMAEVMATAESRAEKARIAMSSAAVPSAAPPVLSSDSQTEAAPNSVAETAEEPSEPA